MDYRIKKDYPLVKFPTGYTEEDRGYEECCVPQMVLAETVFTSSCKNDYTGVYAKLSSGSDSVTFRFVRCGSNVTLTNYGTEIIVPNTLYVEAFVYDWSQILSAYGVGVYQIYLDYTIAGVSASVLWGTYDLQEYSIENALKTARVACVFNSYSHVMEIDWTNSGFKDSFRFFGYIGDRKPRVEDKTLIDKGLKAVKTTRENLWEYTLVSDPMNYLFTSRLVDFLLLHEDECYISDYNAHNHGYTYCDLPVTVENYDLEYNDLARPARVSATFGDRVKKSKTQYNGV